MKQMAFSMTRVQLLRGLKTVTRRVGWRDLKKGEILQAVTKAPGLKKGETPERLMKIEVLDVRVEPLAAITDEEVAREGFPGKDRDWFLRFFLSQHRLRDSDPKDLEVTRIEFKRWRTPLLPPGATPRGLGTDEFQRGLFRDTFR